MNRRRVDQISEMIHTRWEHIS